MLGMPELQDLCQAELIKGVEPAQARKIHIVGSKAGGAEPLSPFKLKQQTLDMELQDLAFALLDSGHALVQFFLTVPHSSLQEWYVCSMPLVTGSINLPFHFTGGL